MSDDIQRLVESLRSPGLESELRGESFAVDAIASTMTAKDASMNNRFSKKARVASFIAAGIIGFGGVAAAGPAAMELVVGTDDMDEEPVAIEEESTDEGTEGDGKTDGATNTGTDTDTEADTDTDTDTESDADSAEREPDEGAESDGADGAVLIQDGAKIECDPDKHSNHGKYVSEVARTEGRTSQQVVEAAQSTCGKKTEDTDETEENEDAEGADEAVDGDPDELECDPDKHTNHGKYVSEVARTKGRTSQQVVDAAQSTCGKKTDDGDSEDTDENEDAEGAEDAEDADEPEDDEEADDADDAPDSVEAEDDRNSRNGNGGGNGNSGNTKANGNGGNGNSNSGNSKANGNGGNGKSGNGRGGK